jgi:hypothetical protein
VKPSLWGGIASIVFQWPFRIAIESVSEVKLMVQYQPFAAHQQHKTRNC